MNEIGSPIPPNNESPADLESIPAANFTEETPIHSGLVVVGIETVDKLDDFVEILARKLLAKRLVDGKTRFYIGDSPNRPFLSAKFREQVAKAGKHRFYGSTRNIRVTFLEPDVSTEKKIVSAKPIQEGEAATFIAEGELHSTGRGNIGSVVRTCIMYVHPNHNYEYYKYHQVGLRSKPLNQAETKSVLNALMKSSLRNTAISDVLAQPHEVRGGLPTLGKGR